MTSTSCTPGEIFDHDDGGDDDDGHDHDDHDHDHDHGHDTFFLRTPAASHRCPSPSATCGSFGKVGCGLRHRFKNETKWVPESFQNL